MATGTYSDYSMYTQNDINFTKDWWIKCCNDPAKMAKWLQKLQNTEIGGYNDYVVALQTYSVDERTQQIFTNIGADEQKHSSILVDLMGDRGISLKPASECPSAYWDYVNAHIHDMETYCAVNYFGEALAAFRFEIIQEMNCTPNDIRNALDIILPDEQFHRTTLKRLAGDEALDTIKVAHDAAFEIVLGRK
jgi:ferritin-like protein